MLEELLDDAAQNNAFRLVHPTTKILLGLGTLLICLVSPTPVVPLLSGIILSIVLLLPARIPARVYGELLLAPAIFVACSIIVLLFMLGGGTVVWEIAPFPWLHLTITDNAIHQSWIILCRVIGCITALFFIALTTPMPDLFNVMKRCRVPAELIDLMMIMYRFIFIFYAQTRELWQAQVMRLGYHKPKESIHSFATLCGMLFISSWEAGEDLIHAMDARCYSGKMPVLDEPGPVRMRSLFPVILYLCLLSGLILIITRSIVIPL